MQYTYMGMFDYITSFSGPRAAFGCTKERILQATKSWAGAGNEAMITEVVAKWLLQIFGPRKLHYIIWDYVKGLVHVDITVPISLVSTE